MPHQPNFDSSRSPQVHGGSRASSPRKQHPASFFNFSAMMMSPQLRERVVCATGVRKISFAELVVEALTIRVNQILMKEQQRSLSGAGAISAKPNQSSPSPT